MDLRSKVALLVRRVGAPEAHRRTGVSREALLRFLAGFPVRAGTLALIERADKDGKLELSAEARK